MSGSAAEFSVLRVADDIGLDIAQLRLDMDAQEIDAHIQKSMRLAQIMTRSLGTVTASIGGDRGAVPSMRQEGLHRRSKLP